MVRARQSGSSSSSRGCRQQGDGSSSWEHPWRRIFHSIIMPFCAGAVTAASYWRTAAASACVEG
jgi:hypothetical protein